jgi:2-dehydropantoate 2-reductase
MIAVVGAGAVGSYFGGMLARAGERVVLIGRPAHVAAIREHGLRIESLAWDERVQVAASTELAVVRGADVVLLCVKTGDTAEAGRALAPHLAPGALVVSLQNGVENADVLRAAAGLTAVRAVVYVAVSLAAPGHVRHTGRGDLILEAPADPARRARLEAFAATCTRAGVTCGLEDDLAPALWVKLVLNCAFNAVSALGNVRYGVIASDPDARVVVTRAIEEARAVALAAGIRLPDDDLVSAAWRLARAMPEATSSTAQDLALGRRTEVDALNGYVARRGTELGVPTPVNQALYALVQLRERSLDPPREHSLDRLRERSLDPLRENASHRSGGTS